LNLVYDHQTREIFQRLHRGGKTLDINGVFYGSRVIDGIRVASPIQIYLDLFGFRGRGEEADNALLDQVIRPTW